MVPLHIEQKKVDGVVESILRGIFERAKRVDEQEFLKAQVQLSSKTVSAEAEIGKRRNIPKQPRNCPKWEELMLASLREPVCSHRSK